MNIEVRNKSNILGVPNKESLASEKLLYNEYEYFQVYCKNESTCYNKTLQYHLISFNVL